LMVGLVMDIELLWCNSFIFPCLGGSKTGGTW
jgi:hypothetical protein